MFSKTYEPRYGDIKASGGLKISSILDMVQDVAICHSEARGYGLEKLKELGFAWLIHGIKAHFDKEIKSSGIVTVTTGIKRMYGLTSERCCEIMQDGKQIGKTITNWFLFDTKEAKPCRIPDEMLAAYEKWEIEDEFFSYKRPKLLEAERLRTVCISNKEIDTNLHLNNCKGAELLMDALPFEFSFTDMSVLYKKAAYLGDELYLCRKEVPDGYYVHLEAGDGEVCVAATFKA